jgi:hypothetical protein
VRRRLERVVGAASAYDCRREIALWLFERGVLAVVDETTAPRPIPSAAPKAAPLANRLVPASAAACVLLGFGAIALVGLRRGATDAPPTEPVASLAPSVVIPSAAPGPTPPPPPPAQVRIAAWPWAEVRIDDAPPFFTPRAAPVALAPGTHRVVFEHTRHGRAERTIEVAPGETLFVRHDFTEGRGS